MSSKSRWTALSILSSLAILGVVILSSSWLVPAAATVSADEMLARFESDTANMVYEWDPSDPRSSAERRRALFDFMNEDYGGAFWIPTSLLDGNVITRAVAGSQESIARDRVGLVLWPENEITRVYGVSPNFTSGEPLGFTSNCVLCHLAEIDGTVYLGAGNKLFDEKALVDALTRLTSRTGRSIIPLGSSDHAMAAKVNSVLKRRRHPKTDPLTRGRSTAYVGAHTEFHIRSHGGKLPGRDEVGRGDAKIPPLWHFSAKAPFDRWYVDGSFHGEIPLLASCMELFKDRPYEDLETLVVPAIEHGFRDVVARIRPPEYPYEIDRQLAARGRELFYSQEIGCVECHGRYDGNGNVDWPGKHVDVGTDPERLDVVSPEFVAAFRGTPLADAGELVRSEGYAATPLTGVWANYPYLHNGSVPTLHHLLGPESERPRIFDVMAARSFDRARVGQVLYRNPDNARLSEEELLDRFGNDRNWFNASRRGYGNRGHDVWPRIKTDANRRALIEYLKTL